MAAQLENARETVTELENQLATEKEIHVAAHPTFECGICLDEHPEDSVARIPQCQHSFCRDCLRGYIQSKLEEHRFPIFCPMCIAGRDNPEPGSVNETLLRDLGVTEKEYNIFEELQMAVCSIVLHCRKCQNTMFVDREEYDENKILECPLPGCRHTWCKLCQQPVERWPGPFHSCDGSLELTYLMQQHGWKFCPGCRVPIQKDLGCNHIMCTSPGCNTHFCYKCGEKIIQSALQEDVRAATTAHFQQCNMFD